MTAPLLDVSTADVASLNDRLAATRWPRAWPVDSWAAGTEIAVLRDLVDYWRTGYDWHTHEAAINSLPSRIASIGGHAVHYLIFEGERPGSPPILLTNGWPSTFLELTKLAEQLAKPTRHGAAARDAFTVIIPSLPGFTFSQARPTLPADLATHEIWHRLMRDELGYDRYAAHGSDLGAGITSRLAAAYPDEVVGIHLTTVGSPKGLDPSSLTDEEREYLDAVQKWIADEGAYMHQQSTRPLTLSYGLSDSPAGLLAWMIEKYRAWSGGGVASLADLFGYDFLLTQASLFWFTNTISTTLRPYYEFGRGVSRELDPVSVPTALAIFPADIYHPPRSWAARTHNVVRYTRMPRGGHFAAWEEPELLAEDLRDFLRRRGC